VGIHELHVSEHQVLDPLAQSSIGVAQDVPVARGALLRVTLPSRRGSCKVKASRDERIQYLCFPINSLRSNVCFRARDVSHAWEGSCEEM
jgi:hypothetical protein